MKEQERIRAKERRIERGAAPRIAKMGWYLVSKAIAKGVLLPPEQFSCVDCCGKAETYDHRFYSRPLEVVPVCRSCNKKRGSASDLEMLVAEAA